MKTFKLTFTALLILILASLAFAESLPDLEVQSVICKKGRFYFTLINNGPGPLAPGWVALANVYFDGVKMGHVDLTAPTTTTGGGLDAVGGTASYLVSFYITAPVTVDVWVDFTDDVTESNEANNWTKGVKLQPCGDVPLPDLVIDQISLDKKCYVNIVAKNIGLGPVPDKVWTVHTPDSSGVYLYRNSKKWGGATIWKFDPAKNLKYSNGTATYQSKLRVSGTESITAVIDHTGKVTENNEGNNKKTVRLTCKAIEPEPELCKWKILNFNIKPKCYNVPSPNEPEFRFSYKVEFKSRCKPVQDLVITLVVKDSLGTWPKPELNVSALTSSWVNGTTKNINWSGERFILRKVNRNHFILSQKNISLSRKIRGDIIATFRAYAKRATGLILTGEKTYIYKECQKKRLLQFPHK